MNLRFTSQQLMWGLFITFGGLALMVLMSDPAFAVGSPSSSNFSCSGGKASGNLIAKASTCPEDLEWSNIFSFLVCHVEVMTSQIFGNIYCGIIRELMPAVKAVLTLATVTFGVGFTIGVIPATGREFITFLLKIAFVWAFATQAEYMIGYGYNFLVAGLRDGTVAAIGSIAQNADGSPIATTAEVYAFLDKGLLKIVGFATTTAGTEWGSGDNMCQNAIFAALAVMAFAFPPIFLLSIMLLFKIVMIFLRACFGYMFSIVGIAFLMILAPIFLSFSLFKQTRPFFDKYLGYLCSFTLQMVIIFTFIAMIFAMNPSQLVGSITRIVMPIQESHHGGSWRWPWQYCTLCKFEVVSGGTLNSDGSVTGGTVKDLRTATIDPADDLLRCKTPREGFRALEAAAPEFTTEGENSDLNILMEFAGTAILSLIILAYLVDQMLMFVPGIAWRLASSLTSGVYAPQIAGGQGHGPGVEFGPLQLADTAGEGFYRGFVGSLHNQQGENTWNTNTFQALDAGMREGGQSLMFGRGEQDPGLVDGFMRFFINPTRTNTNDL